MNRHTVTRRPFILSTLCLGLLFGAVACDDEAQLEPRDADALEMLIELGGEDGAPTELVAFADACDDHEPGDVWEEDCNTCLCSDIGIKLCTREHCETPAETLASSTEDHEEEELIVGKGDRQQLPLDDASEAGCEGHEVGDTWDVECNTCFCNEDGVSECTIIDCDGDDPAWH